MSGYCEECGETICVCEMKECNHLWSYVGSKRQVAWVCARCQALRVSQPPTRDWVDLTDEEIAEAVGSQIDEVYLADFRKVLAKLKEKNDANHV